MVYEELDNSPGTTKTISDGVTSINTMNQQIYSVDATGTPIASVKNQVWATGSGSDAEAKFRALTISDIPATVLDVDNHTSGSTNKVYTIAEQTKVSNLSGTNTGDQNIFQTIAVSGQSNVVADSTTDTLTLAAGTGITITTDAATDTVTIANSIDPSTLCVKSSNLSDLTNAATARTNLGLGTLATQSGTFSGTFSGTSSGTNTGDQNIFQTIAVAGQSDVVADSTTDKLTLAAGNGITLTTNATTDTVTITGVSEPPFLKVMSENHNISGILKAPNTVLSISATNSSLLDRITISPIYIGDAINTLTDVYFYLTQQGAWTSANTNGIVIYGVDGSSQLQHLATLGSYSTFSSGVTPYNLISLSGSIDVSAYTWIYVGIMMCGSSLTSALGYMSNSLGRFTYNATYPGAISRASVTAPTAMNGVSLTTYATYQIDPPLMVVKGTA